MMVYVWLGLLVALIVAELLTTQLVSIWFAAGALASFIVTLAGVEELWIQIVVFVAVSVVALVVTRPIVRKLVNRKAVPTNADMVIGQTGVVTDRIDNNAETGLVKVNGAVWTARTEDGSVIESGEKVEIKEIRGVKLFVVKQGG